MEVNGRCETVSARKLNVQNGAQAAMVTQTMNLGRGARSD
jgi:hypothetical protein